MKSIRHWLKDYFDLSFGERRGIMILITLIFILIILRYALPLLVPSQQTEYDFTEIKQLAALLEENQETAGSERNNFEDYSLPSLEKETTSSAKLFFFDPNTASQEDFQKLGLSPKMGKTIINYRNKGGKFYKKEDLQKIYGIKPGQYQKLEPFISLPSKNDNRKFENEKSGGFAAERSKSKTLALDINSADSADLLKVNGIGPVFASRIIRYRKILGGFVRKEQLLEVYGLDSLHFKQLENQLIVNTADVVKININTAGMEELRRHPYIKYKLANSIVNYRQRNGNYKNLEDLKKIYILDEKTFEKLRPYLVVE